MARPKAGITFWDRVHSKLRLTDNGCHEFTGHKDECGYGRLNGEPGEGLVRIHRKKWELYYGTIPENLCVCHKCDNPACANIEHLFLGTHADNMRDRLLKDRCAKLKGSKNGSSKLHEDDVRIIRSRIRSGEACYAIARDYGVSGEAILHIKNGHSWRHVA